MECFTVLLAVCTSLTRQRAEELLPVPLYLPETCSSECTKKLLLQRLPLALSPHMAWSAVEQALRVTAVLPSLALTDEYNVRSYPLRLRLRLGTADVERAPGVARVRLVGSIFAADAADGPRGSRQPRSPFTASCLGQRCTLTWLERGSSEPLFEFEGSRRPTGEMDGRLKAGTWLRATGRLGFEPGNRIVVHVQDVELGQAEARRGRLTVGGLGRSTFRYFDTPQAKGVSLASEVGPVLGFHRPSSSDVVSLMLTAGPEVLLRGAVSGTVNLGMTYAR